MAQLYRNQQTLNCPCVPVSVTSQPQNPQPVCPGTGMVSFHAGLSGTGPFTCRWKENGVLLSDGGFYSGTGTATLVIMNPTAALSGNHYQCLITNCAGSAVQTDSNAVLIFHTLPEDINGDGLIDHDDFTMLNQVFNTSCSNCREDLIPDGFIDVKDFLQLLSRYFASCQ